MMARLRSLFSRSAKRSSTSADPGEQWAQGCTAMRTMLGGLGQTNEDEFLSLGNALQEYYARSQEMCGASQSVVEQMTGAHVETVGRQLHKILRQLDTYLIESGSRMEQFTVHIQDQIKEIGQIISQLESFKTLSLTLSILGFLTRVENSHISSAGSGFEALTDDVRKLSEAIKEKARNIQTTSVDVLAVMTNVLSKVERLNCTSKASADTMLVQAKNNQTLLIQRYERAVQAAQVIDQRTAEFTESISTMVMSLQFHDITRQQIEHVLAILDQVGAMVKDPQTDLPDRAVMVRDSMELQQAQIIQTRDEFTAAVASVIDSLTGMSGSVHGIFSEIKHMAWAADEQGSASMLEIKNGLSTCISYITTLASEQAELISNLSNAGNMVTSMAGFVKDIEILGLNLEFLALNARIKAAHLGGQGASLDIISGSIYTLSHDTRTNTQSLSQILHHLGEQSRGFLEGLNQTQETQAQTARDLTDRLTALTVTLQDINERIMSKTAVISNLALHLEQDLANTAKGITVHDHVSTLIENSVSSMAELGLQASRHCPQGTQEKSSDFLKKIEGLYTMQRERSIHAEHVTQPEHLKTARINDVDGVEFF